MITGEVRSQVDKMEENKANRTKKPIANRIFPEGKDARKRSYEDLRWSRFKNFEPKEMFEVLAEHVFPFLRTLGSDGSTYTKHMKDARFTIPTPALLAKVVDMIDQVPMVDRELLLADLVRLANDHKDYSGTVERDGTESFRLSYFPKPNEELIEDRRVAWNNGVRSLDSIAPRVLSFIGANGITAPDAETPGASVMAWVLRERLPPEESVRRDELESSEVHTVQREKLKNACRRLKEAIKTYRAALSSLAWISLGNKDK